MHQSRCLSFITSRNTTTSASSRKITRRMTSAIASRVPVTHRGGFTDIVNFLHPMLRQQTTLQTCCTGSLTNNRSNGFVADTRQLQHQRKCYFSSNTGTNTGLTLGESKWEPKAKKKALITADTDWIPPNRPLSGDQSNYDDVEKSNQPETYESTAFQKEIQKHQKRLKQELDEQIMEEYGTKTSDTFVNQDDDNDRNENIEMTTKHVDFDEMLMKEYVTTSSNAADKSIYDDIDESTEMTSEEIDFSSWSDEERHVMDNSQLMANEDSDDKDAETNDDPISSADSAKLQELMSTNDEDIDWDSDEMTTLFARMQEQMKKRTSKNVAQGVEIAEATNPKTDDKPFPLISEDHVTTSDADLINPNIPDWGKSRRQKQSTATAPPVTAMLTPSAAKKAHSINGQIPVIASTLLTPTEIITCLKYWAA